MFRNFFLILTFIVIGTILHYPLVSYGSAAYLKLVTRWKMPDYELTEEFLGREIRAATTYVTEYVRGQEFEDDAPTRLKKFLLLYNDAGLPAFRLVFSTGVADLDFWSIELPGCNPGKCADKDYSDLLVQSDQSDRDAFRSWSSNEEAVFFSIFDGWLFGVHLESFLGTTTNQNGETVTYTVSARRTTTWNPIDKFLNSLLDPHTGEHEFIKIFRKNLVLNTTSKE